MRNKHERISDVAEYKDEIVIQDPRWKSIYDDEESLTVKMWLIFFYIILWFHILIAWVGWW